MKNWAIRAENGADCESWPGAEQKALPPALFHFVTQHELEDLRRWLARGTLPPDLDAKLGQRGAQSLLHRSIEQNCRLFFALLLAAEHGSFPGVSPAQRDRLLRVLAYVRLDEDLIPDYREDGFADDQREVRAVVMELGPLLNHFKAWRLRNQVPGMWRFSLGTGMASS